MKLSRQEAKPPQRRRPPVAMNALCWLSLSGQHPRLADHRPKRQRLRAQELVVRAGDDVGLVELPSSQP